MAVFTVTTANYADPAFWNSISLAGPGHTLDFSSLPSSFMVYVLPSSSAIWILDGNAWYAISEAGGGGTFSFASPTEVHYFSQIITGDVQAYVEGTTGADTLTTGADPDMVFGGAGNDIISTGGGNDSVAAGSDNDSVNAGDGADTIFGDAGNDTLNGNAGSDILFGGSGDDSMNGESGDDRIAGGTGNDTANGGIGNDTITGDDFTATGPNLIVNGSFEDTTGMSAMPWGHSDFDGSITGWTDASGYRIDLHNDGRGGYSASDGANWIDMEGGVDEHMAISQTVAGITSGQVYTLRFDVADLIDANDGTALDNQLQVLWNGEVIATIDSTDGYWSTYELNLIGGSGNGTNTLTFQGLGGNDQQGVSLDNIQMYATAEAAGGTDSLVGGDGDDDLMGGAGNDTLDGGTGADVITSGSGNDSVLGGSGNDTIWGGTNNDTLIGGTGNDLMDGGGDRDTFRINAGDGTDTIIGGETGNANDSDAVELSGIAYTVTMTGFESGTYSAADGTQGSFSEIETVSLSALNDTFQGGSSTSALYVSGNAGADVFTTGSGNDSVVGGSGADTVVTGDGQDTVWGGLDNDVMQTGAGNDLVIAGSGNDLAELGSGDDRILAESGNDTVFGGDGNDSIQGDTNNDVLEGDAGNDTLLGGDHTDTLFGGTGSDQLFGGGANDSLRGGADGDALSGGTGADILFGDDDADTFTYTLGDGIDTIFGGEGGTDRDALQLNDSPFNDSSMVGASVTYVAGEEGSYTLGSSGGGTFSEIEVVQGTASRDAFAGSAATDDIEAYGMGGSDTMQGGSGDDTLYGGTGADSVLGGAGADLLHGEDDGDTLGGAQGSDTLFGGLGDDSLDGGADDDQLVGDSGNDTLDGGDGNDTIRGGAGNDSLTGGSGSDTFVVARGGSADVIADFSLADTDGDGRYDDQLDISELRTPGGNPVTALDVTVSDDGNGNALLTFPEGETIVLMGVSPSQMQTFGQKFAAGIPCFTARTMILTPRGERPIERLRPGDLVLTRDNGPQPLVWAGMRRLDAVELAARPDLRPVAFEPGALGQERRLLVSPQHGMLTGQGAGEALVRACHLARLPGSRARIAKGVKSVTYVHLMFETHQVIWGNGLPSESFYPGPWGLSALDGPALREVARLFPEAVRRGASTGYGATARPFVRPTDRRPGPCGAAAIPLAGLVRPVGARAFQSARPTL